MRVALHPASSDCLKPIFDNELSKEETLELVVPDVNADIGNIIDVRGQLLLSSQKAKTDEVYLQATVEVTVIYAADDSGKVQYLMTSIPVEMTIPVQGADENTKIVTQCELCSLDVSTLNPRKLLLRAEVKVHISCYVPDKFVLWDNLSEEEKAPVYVLQKELTHTLVLGVREKSFVVSDEYKLPAAQDQNAKMLSAGTEICVEDAKVVGNKVVIKALANTTAIFLSENDGKLFDSMFTTQFSQIIELDTFGEGIDNSVIVQLKDAEFTMLPGRENGLSFSASLHMFAQVTSRQTKSSVYIADAYSNEYKLTVESTQINTILCSPVNILQINIRARLQQKAPLSEIMYAAVNELCTEINGTQINCRANIGGAGLTEDGAIAAIEQTMTADEKIELTMNQRAVISSVCHDNPVIMGTMQNAELSVAVTIEYFIREYNEISAVSSIELSDEKPERHENNPSLVVLCSDKETDLWTLAKKYGSTMEMIKNANSMDGEFIITCRPLLIPRAN